MSANAPGLVLGLAMLATGAQAQAGDPVRGYQLYHETPGGRSCSTSACHGEDPTENRNGVLAGADNPAAIQAAIDADKGGMGVYADILDSVDLQDLASYLGDPAAGAGPSGQVSPTALSFPATDLGATSAAQSVSFSNNGNAALHIGPISSDAEFPVVGGSCRSGDVLNVGASCGVSLSFKPSASGSRSGVLSISHDAANSPSKVSLSGQGRAPGSGALSVSPAALDFGEQALATPSTAQTLSVSNGSASALSLDGIALQGAQTTDYGWSGSCAAGATVPAGGHCSLSVVFTPAALGAGSATLSITAGSNRLSVPLSGTGVAPARLLPASLDFGSVTVGQEGAAQTLSFSNAGSDPLAFTAITSSSGDFPVLGGSCVPGIDLAPQGSCGIVVGFAPTQTGVRNATLAVSGGGLAAPVTAALGGNGLAATPVASLNPAALAYSTVVGTASEAQTALLSNTGSAPLNLIGVALEGSSAGEYRLLPAGSCAAGLSLASGSACSLLVEFTPAASGSRLAQVAIRHDDAAHDPSILSLNGSGTRRAQGQLSVDAVLLDFGTVAAGGSVLRSLGLYNSGSADLSLGAPLLSGAAAQDYAVVDGSDCPFDARLAAGAACTVEIAFGPAASSGARAAQLGIDAGTAGSASVSLSGVATAADSPVLTLSPQALDFGRVLVDGAPVALNLLLSNGGSAELRLDAIVIDHPAFVLDAPCAAQLGPDGFCWMAVRFNPSAEGRSSGLIQVSSNDAQSPATVAVSGEGVRSLAQLDWLDGAPQFPDTVVGAPGAAQSLLMVNSGSAAARFERWNLSGAAAADFAVDAASTTCPQDGAVLEPAEICTLGLLFNPSTAGTRSATLTLDSDAAGPTPVPLQGQGVAPALPALSLRPSPMVLTTDVDNQLQPQALVVANQGAGRLSVTAVEAPGSLSLGYAGDADGGSCAAPPITLEPGASCTILVAPATGGDIDARLSVSSNDPAGSAQVKVQGYRLGNQGGGGCSIGRPGNPNDPVWAVLLLGSALVLVWRRRHPGDPWPPSAAPLPHSNGRTDR